jgi:hypothetical protein
VDPLLLDLLESRVEALEEEAGTQDEDVSVGEPAQPLLLGVQTRDEAGARGQVRPDRAEGTTCRMPASRIAATIASPIRSASVWKSGHCGSKGINVYTASAPRNASVRKAGSAGSPTYGSASELSRASLLSDRPRTRTVSPAASSCRVICAPVFPVAPITLIMSFSFGRLAVSSNVTTPFAIANDCQSALYA